MKKKVFFALLLSSLTFANFLDGMQEIDKYLQKDDYKTAYKVGQDLLNEELSEDDRAVLLSILEEIEAKIPKTQEIYVKLNIDQDTKNEAFKAVTNNDYRKMKEYEKEIIKNANPELINQYAKFYISSGLLENAYNIALKDNTRDVRNIYLAATALRMLGNYDKSISLYNEVLNKNPQSYQAMLGLAVNYKLKKQYNKALKYLTNYAMYNNSPEIQKEIQILQTLE